MDDNRVMESTTRCGQNVEPGVKTLSGCPIITRKLAVGMAVVTTEQESAYLITKNAINATRETTSDECVELKGE